MSFSLSDENHASRSVNTIQAFTWLPQNLEVIDLSYRMLLPTFHMIFQSFDMLRVLKLNGLCCQLFLMALVEVYHG
jgi:hypothetical protein